jgi:hypothetical protein
MRTYKHFCARLGPKSLNIYRCEICFEQPFHRIIKHKSYVHYSSRSLKGLKAMEKTYRNVYALATFPNFFSIIAIG